jgi:hypothetical protein
MSLNQTYPGTGMGMVSHGSMIPSSLGMSGLDPYSSLGLGGMSGLGMGMGMGMGSMMMGGMPRSRRNPYYDTYGYGGGGVGGRGGYGGGSPYELFDEAMYDDGEMYMDDYDDIEDPLLAYLRMQQRGGGGRRGGGRRGRRYYGGGGYGSGF